MKPKLLTWPATVSLFFGILLLVVAIGLRQHRAEFVKPLIPPPVHLEWFSLGYKDPLADVLWLRVIQDFDHCEKMGGKVDANTHELGTGGFCLATDKGWTYQMLDVITRLAPRFKIAYQTGGSMLSVLVHDHEGGRLLLERGVENFPDDWRLIYELAFHEMHELNEPQRAAGMLVEAGRKGAPGWVYSLAAKLMTQEGQAEFSKRVLEEMIEADPDSRWAPRLRQRLDEANEAIKKAQSH